MSTRFAVCLECKSVWELRLPISNELKMIKKLFLLVLCLANLLPVNSIAYNDTALIRGLADRRLFKFYNSFGFNETIDFLQLLANSETVNQKCKVSLKRWIAGIEASELWALKVLQSTGKQLSCFWIKLFDMSCSPSERS